MERPVLLPGSNFCDTRIFGICLCFLKSYITAGGCYIFIICVKNLFSISIKFLFCKSFGWSATKRDGQTASEKMSMLIKREYFRFFKTSKHVGWNRLNLSKELKQASRILDLGLETPLLKFTQLYLFMPIAWALSTISHTLSASSAATSPMSSHPTPSVYGKVSVFGGSLLSMWAGGHGARLEVETVLSLPSSKRATK